MIDVADYCVNSPVASPRVLLHRGQAHQVEIAAKRPVVASVRHRGWPERRVGQRERPPGFARAAGGVGRQTTGSELVKNEPQRVDVGEDADRCSAQLLRGRVRGSHHLHPCRLVGRAESTFELFGDAEIEELGRPLRCHQNVGWLEIAMDNRVPVRVGHRFAHRAKKAHAGANPQCMVAAVRCEGYSIHILHREPGRPIGERVRVVQTRDVGMIELREVSLLAHKSFASNAREPRIAQELDRDLCAEIGALGEVHDAHSPFADQPDCAVGADLVRWPRRAISSKQALRDLGDAPVEHRRRTFVGGEQPS